MSRRRIVTLTEVRGFLWTCAKEDFSALASEFKLASGMRFPASKAPRKVKITKPVPSVPGARYIDSTGAAI